VEVRLDPRTSQVGCRPRWIRRGEGRLSVRTGSCAGRAIFAYLVVTLGSYGDPTGLAGFGPSRKGYFACSQKLHVKRTRQRRPLCRKCNPPVQMVRISVEEYRLIKRR